MAVDLNNVWGEQPLAVVIGAGGMGTAVARRLGQGYRLLLVDIDPQRLNEKAVRLREDGLQVGVHCCDVTRAASVAELAAHVESLGGFKTIAHVAGLSPSMANWRTILSVNLVGPSLMMEALLPHVQPGTSAVLISSLSAHLRTLPAELQALLDESLGANFLSRIDIASGGTMTPQLSYMWSKIGVIRLAQRQAVTWGRKGGRVVSLSPGIIASPQGADEFKQSSSKLSLLKSCPLQRQGNLQEIAGVVAFLVSDRASYINGTDILVDGGNLAATQFGNR